MGRWTDLAEWRGTTVNEGDGDGTPGEAADRAVECRGCVLHIADGYYEGTIAWQKNAAADVSSQFVVAGPRDISKGTPDGRIGQVVDTDDEAWTQRAGNGHWLSIELSGFSGDALSPAQIESCARILAKGHQVYGYPLQIATSPAGKGLGHHSMGTNGRNVPTDTWTGATWGHELCPGPQIVAQKGAILARAIQIVNGTATQEDDVARVFNYKGGMWVSGGGARHLIVDGNALTDIYREFPGTVAPAGNVNYDSWSEARINACFGPDANAKVKGDPGPAGPAVLVAHTHGPATAS